MPTSKAFTARYTARWMKKPSLAAPTFLAGAKALRVFMESSFREPRNCSESSAKDTPEVSSSERWGPHEPSEFVQRSLQKKSAAQASHPLQPANVLLPGSAVT